MREHTFEPLERFEYHVESWRIVRRKLSQCLTQRQRLLVVTGPLGAGKSSCMGTAVNETCIELGWLGLQVPSTLLASPLKNLDAIGAILSERLHLPRNGEKNSRKGAGQQSVGNISNSADVSTIQQSQNVSLIVYGERQPEESNEGYLIKLLGQSTQPVCFLVDNAHVLIRHPKWEDSIFASIIKLATIHPRVACVVCVEDTWFGKLCSVFEAIGIDGPELCYLSGITQEDAKRYCDSSVSPALPDSISDSLIAQIADDDGIILPLRLQATLEVVAKDTVRDDAVSSSDLGRILGTALKIRIRPLGKARSADALFVLNALAALTVTKYIVTPADLTHEIGSIPREQLDRIVADLVSLRILISAFDGGIQFVHDGVRQAVLYLQYDAFRSDLFGRIDELTTNWFRNGVCLAKETLVEICRSVLHFDREALSAPLLLTLAGSAFEIGVLREVDNAVGLKSSVANLDYQYLHSLLQARARHTGRAEYLDTTEIFLLLLSPSEQAANAAIDYAFKLLDHRQLWSHKAITQAFSESKQRFLLKALCNNEIARRNELLVPLLINCTFGSHIERPNDDELQALWDSARLIAPIEVLQVMATHCAVQLDEAVADALSHRDAEVKGVAIQVAVRRRTNGWHNHFVKALESRDLTLLRKAIIALPEALEGGANVDVLALFRSNQSPVIREAIIDISPDLPANIRFTLLAFGMADDAEIVRESTVFAACWGLDSDKGRQLVLPYLGDQSPLVREAILYAYRAWGLVPPPEILLRDVRSGSESLRNAARRFLEGVSTDHVMSLISSVLLSKQARKSERLEALFAAKFMRLDECIRVLDQFLTTTDDVDELASVVDVLEAINTPLALSRIATLAHHHSAFVRERAVYALARIGGRAAISELEQCISDPDPHVQARVIFGLGRLGEWDFSATIRLLPHRSNNVSRAIEWFQNEAIARQGNAERGFKKYE